MITSVYAHILDEDRKVNAQKFEDAFYASANPDLRTVRPPAKTRGPKEPESPTLDLEALVEQLRKSPELANTLAALLASPPSGKQGGKIVLAKCRFSLAKSGKLFIAN